tara:strand:- start:11550 stop:13481 length:1932 start_codon:yes stop_codon:yes gene_type:complete
MVLQQKQDVAIWGTYTPKEKVIVKGSWGEETSTITDLNGNWKLTIPTPEAGGPYEVNIVTNDKNILLEDVMIGEVWLASGQSNMEMDFDYCCNTTDYSEIEISNANYPQIRMLNVTKQLITSPANEFEGEWKIAVKKNITKFSAAGYFFAKRLHKELNVPIGIIHSSWGGTDVEAWTSREKLSTLGFLDKKMESYDKLVEDSSKSKKWFSQFKSINIPSDIWYLFLGDKLGFPDKWSNLNFNDGAYIASDYSNYENWKQIELPGSFDNIFKTNDFNGAILFRKSFTLHEIKGDYSLHLGAISDMDFSYINGEKIGSSLGKASGRDKVYKIPKKLLKIGENNILIRVINQYGDGKVGTISLNNTTGGDLSLAGKWNYRVSAEIYGQINSFKWPFKDFYLYDNEDINFSERPPVVNYTSNATSGLFNGMINPLIPYNIKGTIWYQGENNVQRFKEYETLFPALIEDWREKWNTDFSFYFVQIAPFYNYNGLSSSLRDAQRKSLSISKTGMVVTLDIGEINDIHPSNKHDVGNRLAGLALAKDYGKLVVPSGPLYKSYQISRNKLLLEFDFIGSGLMSNGSILSEFEIAGANKKYVPAEARIVDNKVQVFSSSILNPKYARYAWRDISTASLFNKEGLPASSFTTE